MHRIELKVPKDHPRVPCGGRWRISIHFNRQHDGTAAGCAGRAKWLFQHVKTMEMGYTAIRVVNRDGKVVWRKRIKR